MRSLITACVSIVLSVPAMSQVVGLSGDISLSWGGHTPGSQSAVVSGSPTTLSLPSVGTVTAAAFGAVAELRLTAEGPFPPGHGFTSTAAGSIVVQFASSPPRAGVFRLTASPVCVYIPPQIDVGDDGFVEVGFRTPNPSVDVPALLGPVPIPIRIRAHTFNPGVSGCSYTVRVEFVPQPLRLSSLGNRCGPGLLSGPGMSAWISEDVGLGIEFLNLRVRDVRGSLAALAIGASPGPAWPFSCPLQTDILTSVTLASPAATESVFLFRLPPAATGTFRLQLLEFFSAPPIDFATSNGIQIVL